MNDFLQAMQARRSYYALSKASPVGDERLEALVRQAVAHTPSAFNMQSGRAVLLLGMHHDKLWQITLEALAAVTPPERFEATRQKIAAFAAGHGTVLFFDDTAVTQSFARQNPLYSASFPVWAQQAGGMLQFAVWTLLEEAGLGASLQHYNPPVSYTHLDVYKRQLDALGGQDIREHTRGAQERVVRPQYFSERFAHAERLNCSPPFLRWGTSVLRL